MRSALVILSGPSGSGKSYLATRYGAPHVALDHFYREQAEDAHSPLPRTAYGEIDWDHPGTWNHDGALAALCELVTTGAARTPVYEISTSSITGTQSLSTLGGPIVAEGLFAYALLPALTAAISERHLDVDLHCYYIDEPRALNAASRFVRDVAESRKPLPFLLKRGWSLFQQEQQMRAEQLAAGFTPLSKRHLKKVLGRLNAEAAAQR